MSAVDIAQLVSAVAAFGALVAAGVQIRGLRRDARDGRVGEILGVAVDTDVVHRPVKADQPGGRSMWEYRFSVHNPGRFPITNLDVRIEFTSDQQRMHYDGSLDAPSRLLEMGAPVIPARSTKAWTRRIVIDHSDHKKLRGTVASVAFMTPDAGAWKTKWPDAPHATSGDKRLRKRLHDGLS